MLNIINEVLQGLDINGTCVKAQTYRHLAYFDISLNCKASALKKLERSVKDIALHIKSKTIPIVKLIPECGLVRLQVALKEATAIPFIDIYDPSTIPQHMIFPLLMGETDSGKPLWMDMVNNPHLIIAGGTGSGKSTLLHTFIANALLLNALKIRKVHVYLSDPKQIEFSEYQDDQLLSTIKKIVCTYEDTIKLLIDLEKQMNDRYYQMKQFQIRNIEEDPNKFPLVLCIIDEVADLMIQDKHKNDLQNLIIKIAQKGRAAGVFLMLATQRPSVDIITGLIKANFPGRIACKTASRKDSEIILDRSGAEMLLGRGDAILKNMANNEVRFQVAYITPQDVVKNYKYLVN